VSTDEFDPTRGAEVHAALRQTLCAPIAPGETVDISGPRLSAAGAHVLRQLLVRHADGWRNIDGYEFSMKISSAECPGIEIAIALGQLHDEKVRVHRVRADGSNATHIGPLIAHRGPRLVLDDQTAAVLVALTANGIDVASRLIVH